MKKRLPPPPPAPQTAEPLKGELLLYQTDEQGPRLEVRLHDESIWLTLNQMADLFQVDKHFVEVEQELKAIETGKKNRLKPTLSAKKTRGGV